ncbi:MAG TPA: hypothetical protein VGI81_28945, partial [Tepidisphaeraceae bacterium]
MAIAAPIGSSQLSRLYAEEAKGDRVADSLSAADLIRQGREQFEQKQYEQAEKSLAAVKTAGLGDKDREAYLSLLTDVKHAAAERRAAREALQSGQDAVNGDQTLEAIAQFRAAAGNQFADSKTVSTANEQLAKLQKPTPRFFDSDEPAAAAAPATQPTQVADQMTGKQYYELGVGQYRAGDWAHAKQSLQLALNDGFKPESLYQDPPSVYLKRMGAREQSDVERVQHLSQVPTTAPADAGTTDPLQALKATDEARTVRRDQATKQAQEWVREAQDAQRSNNYDRALDLYSQAANIDPNNAAAIQGRDQMLTLLGRNPSPQNLGQTVSEDVRARQGEIRFQVQSNLDQAHASIQQGNWATAQIAIDRARLASQA